MSIRNTMNLRWVGIATVCLILLSVITLRGSGGTQNTVGGHLLSRDMDDAMVEKILSNCWVDMKGIGSLDISILEGIISGSTTINEKTGLFVEGSIQEAITLLPPESKHILLDCLNKHNFHFSGPGDDHGTANRYHEHMESSLDWNSISRRNLAGQPFQTSAPASSPAPALAPTLILIKAHEVQSPSHGPAPSHAPTLSPGPAPSSSSFPDDLSPSPGPGDLFPPESIEPTQASPSVVPQKNQNNSKKSVVIAVVLTAVGTSLVAACLCCCYCGWLRNKDGLENRQRDDRPLLSLSSSDFSGSSQKSFGLTSSIVKDKFEDLSSKMDSSQNGYVLPLNGSSENTPSGGLSGKFNSSIELSTASTAAPPSIPVFSTSTENTVATLRPPHPPLKPPPGRKVASPPPAPPPPLPNVKPGPRPPPPPKSSLPPRPPQTTRPSPLGPHHSGNADLDADAPKTKLKPFFWDKVSTNPDQSMVWNQIKSGSFQFNEEMIETLFGYTTSGNKNKGDGKESSSGDPSTQYVKILDPKKSQNLAISLKALNVKIEEVCDALLEGNELPADLLQTLLRMPPTTDEELKLRLYNGDFSLLGPAERFLKTLVDIPFAFKRMDALLFMSSLEEDASTIKDSFSTLEVACLELRNSRLFLKLLEAVLKTGNRMNDGTFRGGAQAFKLDTLLKLSDVKGTDGKTTLLHFVVQEMIRSEGVRAARMARESGSISSLTTISSINSDDFTEDTTLETGDHYRNLGLKVVSGLGNELENVKKAAGLDADALTSTVAILGHRLVKIKEFLNTDMRSLEEESGFHHSLKSFVEHAESDITSLLDEEKRIRSHVKSTTDYFHGNAGKDEGFRLFVIVRDFLGMVDKACKDARSSPKKVPKAPKTKDNPKMETLQDPRQRLFPAIKDRRVDSSSSDDEA